MFKAKFRIRHAASRIILILIAVLLTATQTGLVTFADPTDCPLGGQNCPLPPAEVQALSLWPNWVPEDCSQAGNSSTPTATNSVATGGSTIDQVKTFASEPVTSTWNISNSTVEQWFLKQAGAQATIAKYGLNSGNIGQITSAIEAAGVSPVFFYLDTVNEGGGAGGFINHYGSDVPGGGPANAKNDSQYIVSESHTTADGPATGGGEPADLPTAEAKSILDSLQKGSLGVYYIQATSAVTAELETLSGKTGDWSNNQFGTPLEDMMNNIKTMGGDPMQGSSTISSGGGCCGGGADTSGPSAPTVMYDTLNPSVVPSSAQVIASYVGGGRHGFSQINSGVDAVSINETPGDNTSADIWADEEDVNVTSATGAAQPGFHSNNSHSAAEVAAAIANWVHQGSPTQLSPTGEAKGAYGTPGSGFQLQQIENLLSNRYHVSRNQYVVWSDGLYPNGQPRSQSLPPGTDANQNAINLGGGYDTSQITPAFLAGLGFSNGGDPMQGSPTISTGGCATGSVTGAGMQKGISFAVAIANNNGYGYDQSMRQTGWEKYQSDQSCTSQCGSFDCSSFISAIVTEAGYFTTNPNFSTDNEASELEGVGFKQVATSATTSANLQPGDILLAANHTEMYIGNNQNVGAHIDENGGASGGQVGDQTGNEISVTPFYDDSWIGVFRAPN